MRQNFKPSLSKPVDFDSFWDKTKKELDDVLHQPTVNRMAEEAEEGFEAQTLSFRSLGNVEISSYFIQHKDNKKRPLVIHSHGYGSKCLPMWSWAKQGLNVIGFDARGFGRSKDAVSEISKWGYVLTGKESPERHILRGAVCDYMRAVQVGQEIFEGQISQVIFNGTSFAGALAIMAEANLQLADLLVVAVPTFGWGEGRFFFTERGSGSEINEYLEKRHEEAEDLMLVLKYFDSVNFAGKIKCPTLIGTGLKDQVVPAETVYAIANHIQGPHEVMEFPVSHSNEPEVKLWRNFDARWIPMALNGIPKNFGKP